MTLSLTPNAPTPPGATTNAFVKDVDMSNFMKDVIEASKTSLIIVDFWATWCGPCKQLTPALEKLVATYKGAVRLAKLDIDRNPDIAQQMGIQSVPAVFAFFQGRPVDGFMGALPEKQVKAWIDKLLQATGAAPAVDEDAFNADAAMKQAEEFIAQKNIDMAEAVYADVLDAEPENAQAFAGLLRCMVMNNKLTQAKVMLAAATPEQLKHKAIEPVRAAIAIAEQGAEKAGATADLEAKVAKNPADHQARLDLALASFAGDNKESAIDHLLESIRKDRNWNEQAARKQLVSFFDVLGPTDPLTIAGRKRLSSILFA